MHVRYNCFSDLTFSFHSLFINLNNECNVLVTVAIFICTWTLKLNFWFSQTFNHHMHIFDFMIMLLSRIIIWLSVVLWLLKCINSDFESLNYITLFLTHVKRFLLRFSAFSHFCQYFFSQCKASRRQYSWVTVNFRILRKSLKTSIEYKLEIKWVR